MQLGTQNTTFTNYNVPHHHHYHYLHHHCYHLIFSFFVVLMLHVIIKQLKKLVYIVIACSIISGVAIYYYRNIYRSDADSVIVTSLNHLNLYRHQFRHFIHQYQYCYCVVLCVGVRKLASRLFVQLIQTMKLN